MSTNGSATHLGFLTILSEGNSFLGGYLITNAWGRPIEFRLSTAVQPNKVQQILYGPTLANFLSSELIGKTLFDKAGTPVHAVMTDSQDVLDLRRSIPVPVALVRPQSPAPETEDKAIVRPAEGKHGPIVAHPEFPEDLPKLREMFDHMASGLEIAEPFQRIREAVAEARRMGVTQRG